MKRLKVGNEKPEITKVFDLVFIRCRKIEEDAFKIRILELINCEMACVRNIIIYVTFLFRKEL